MPYAYQAGRVCGEGTFVLLSCKMDDGIRNARLSFTEGERNLEAFRWKKYGGCGVLNCKMDHPMIELKDDSDESTNSEVSTALQHQG